jgi:hypothetical protein
MGQGRLNIGCLRFLVGEATDGRTERGRRSDAWIADITARDVP